MEHIVDRSSPPIKAYVLNLNALLKAGNLKGALSLLDGVPANWRNRRQILVPAAEVQMRNGQYAEALVSIKAAHQAGASSERLFSLQARIHKSLGDTAAYVETLRAMVKKFPDSIFGLSQLSLHYLSLNQIDEARAVAEALPDTDKWQAFRLSLEYRQTITRADLVGISTVLHRIVSECPVCPPLPGLNKTLRELPEADREDLVQRISMKWPDMIGALRSQRVYIATKQPERNRIQQAMTLAIDEQMFEAQRLLSELGTENRTVSDLLRLFECVPPKETLLRPPVVDSGAEVVQSPKGFSGTTLLMFAGFADMAMVPIGLIDRFCAAEGHSAIYLRDADRSAYISGIPALAGDFEGTLAALSTLLEQYGTQKLLCLGTSLGGFAAIRYGIRLKAERVMGASAPTNLTSDFTSSIGDNRGQLLVRRLQRTFATSELDLRPEVAAENGRCKIDLWFGDEYANDINHASYLSGCEGVSQFPIPGLDRHGSLPLIVAGGGFQKFLAS